MKESDRMRLLICDCCDTMSRMSDVVLDETSRGISDELEDMLLSAEDEKIDDLIASCIMVIMAIIKPLNEQTLASTSGRNKRSQKMIDELLNP